MNPRALRRAAPAAIVVLGILIALGWVLPKSERQPFYETLVWSLVVATSFVGWGSLVAFAIARDERVDLGLRAIWGASALAFIGGVLMVPSLMTRTVALIFVEVGVVLAIVSLVRERERVFERWRFTRRFVWRFPRLAIVAVIVFALLAIHYLAGIAEWHTDPYDDDIAYLSFVKKLLDTGSFPEPFSLRRISSLGGQTFFLALVALRAAPNQAHTFDRSIAILLFVLLVIGHRARGRRPWFLFVVATLLLVPTLPLVSRNTAPYYSAIAFFVGLFRTVIWAGERDRLVWRTALPIALVAAVVCTLRQNYLPIPILFLGALYLAHIRKTGPKEPGTVAAFTALALAPWLISAWTSNHSFLFPLVPGTYNRAIELTGAKASLAHEARVFLWTTLEGLPIATVGIFFLAGMLAVERDKRKPLLWFVLASLAGFALLIHALNKGDPTNLGRYAFGFAVASAVAVALTTGTTRLAGPSWSRMHVAAGLTLLALLVQLGRSADAATKYYSRALRNVDEATEQLPRSAATKKLEDRFAEEIQLSVPPGQRLAVLLDEPHWLDYARNPIWNLDMPGYSSLPPGMPFFLGSAPVEAYLKDKGVRYIAFVRPDRSRYHYRREYWMQLLVDEMEIWRTFAPYVIDFCDNLMDLSTKHKKLFDRNGIIVLDLAEGP